MKYSGITAGLMAVGALAAPLVERQSANIDPTILQFALTLEHLENVFYHGALQKFSVQDFIDAGYSATYYNNLKYISYDEQSHVQLLSSAIAAAGYTPVQACQYKFPYTDVKSFITLSSVLEGVGTSAYLAGAPLITSKQYLAVAGSILVTEALHTSMQRGAIGEVPMANPYGTALDPTSVYTLAAMFITSCPASNAALPFTPFPTLSYSNPCRCEEPDCSPSQAVKRGMGWESYNETSTESMPAKTTEMSSTKSMPAKASEMSSSYESKSQMETKTSSEYYTKTSSASASTMTAMSGSSYCAPPSAGATIMLTAASAIPAGSYVTFVSGLSVVSVQGSIDGMNIHAAIPSVASGQTYVFVTKSDVEGTFMDTAVLFGPAIVEVNPAPAAIDYSIY